MSKCISFTIFAFIMVGCAGKVTKTDIPTEAPKEQPQGLGDLSPHTSAPPPPVSQETTVREGLKKISPGLSWEDRQYPERAQWSQILMQVVASNKLKFDKAKDIQDFCPKYKALSSDYQVRAISEVIVAIIYFESGFKETSRVKETALGTDCVTKQPVFSEGLLQLSYCDKTWAKFCRFDWGADKGLSSDSPKKTILDPAINLTCGVGIMADQVSKKEALAFTSGNYWAVLRPDGKYGQVPGIKARVKKHTPFCF